jgi:hypothetical protein
MKTILVAGGFLDTTVRVNEVRPTGCDNRRFCGYNGVGRVLLRAKRPIIVALSRS